MQRKLQVLVLDDEAILNKRLKTSLQKIGCDVETFMDPQRAFARIDVKEFDTVVTDVVMDDIDGFQILEHVARRSPRASVIMMTGYATMAMAREAMDKGAFDFISKPFALDAMRSIVARSAAARGIAVDYQRLS